MKNRYKLSGLLLSLTLVFSSLGTAASAASSTPSTSTKQITILHTNDIHARAIASSPEMGLAKLTGIINQYRSDNPNTLLLDAGDAVHGTTFATLVEGESIVKVMNLMGYEAIAPGNHEFNYGSSRLVELSSMMEFPMISANVREKNGDLLFDPYLIKEIDGVKLGIIGLTTPETSFKTHPNNVKDITFTDPIKEIQTVINEIQDKVDIVIALGHIGMDESSEDTSLKIVREVEGIDVFIDGHSHTVLKEGMLSDHGTLIASAGEYSKYLGVIELQVQDGKVINKKASLIDEEQAADVVPDPKVDALVQSIVKEQESILSEVVGKTPVKLEGAREKVRTSETNLGDLLTDAMRDITGAEVAITNGGGLRASIEAGDITKGSVITVLPFGNQIVTLNVTGADIKAALENGVTDYPEAKGAFPQVSGLSFKIDPAGPAGSRVHDVKVGDKAIDLKATYSLATNDFLAAGGDEYTMFGQYPQAGMYGSLDEALITYIAKGGKIPDQAAGRITEAAITASPETTKQPATPGSKPLPKPDAQATPSDEAASQPEPHEAGDLYYIVKRGDNLTLISKKYNTTWQKLQQLNKLKNPNLIYPGQKILLPAS